MIKTKRSLAPFLLFTFSFFILSFANAQYTKLMDFDSTKGSNPNGSLVSDGTFLYGMTENGGAYNSGIIFKIKKDGTGYSKLLEFGSINASWPKGDLIYDGTFLYGMTWTGGAYNGGIIFKIKPDGTGFSELLDFGPTSNGDGPLGSLISDGTFLYGMTSNSVTGGGTVFKIKLNGTGYAVLLDLGTVNGYYPTGNLVSDGTFLYGMTQSGGAYTYGMIFKIKPDGTGYSDLFDFADTAGGLPYGSLISDGSFLYGMAQLGTINHGVIFKIKLDGTGFSKLYDFGRDSFDGINPHGSLVSEGSFLYGMTTDGDTNNLGAIFKIKSDGTGYSKLFAFNSIAGGSHPLGSLVSDGNFLYGMTSGGGTKNKGVIFKYALATTGIAENTVKSRSEKLFDIYPNPNKGIFTISINDKLQTSNNELTIYNMLGEIIYSTSNNKPQTSNTFDIDISLFPKGMYFIKMFDGENRYSEKIVLE